MEHTWYVCKGNHDTNCYFCVGGLAACTVCGGFEGSLTSECYGTRLPEHFLDVMVYQDGWDFYDGSWHPPVLCEDCGARLYRNRETGQFFDCPSLPCRTRRACLYQGDENDGESVVL